MNLKLTLVFSTIIILILGSSCGKNKRSHKSVEDFNKLQSVSRPITFDPGKSDIVLSPNNFANDFCGLIKEGGNPFLLEKYFKNNDDLEFAQTILDYLKDEKYSCEKPETLVNQYPLQLFKFKTNKDKIIFLALTLNKNNEAKSPNVKLFDNDILFSLEMIKGEDGARLATFVFRKDEAIPTRPLILTRTPYFHTGSSFYLTDISSSLNGGYNVAISENRGVHMSDGDFEWLTNKNISDGKATVEYLAKPPFSNGKILNYGESYDGFNALAASIDKPTGLVATIACSSPSNAITDSFTSNGTFELSLLNYIWKRETGDEISNLDKKLNHLKKVNTPLSEYDNKLFGRDLKEWEDILSLQSKAEIQSYWSSRDISKQLKNIQTPIFHIAGFSNDQDSRDVMLAWEQVKNLSNHHLFLHLKGHGCGDFFETDYYNNLKQSLFSNNPVAITSPKVIQQKADGTYITDNTFPPQHIETSKIDLPPASLTATQLQVATDNHLDTENIIGVLSDNLNQDDEERTLFFEIPNEHNVVIAGVMELNLNIFVKSKLAYLSLGLKKKRLDGSTEILHRLVEAESISRSSLLLNDTSDNHFSQHKIIMPPILSTFSPGDKLILILKTNATFNLIDLYHNERENYFEANKDGYIFIMGKSDGSSYLTIPYEK